MLSRSASPVRTRSLIVAETVREDELFELVDEDDQIIGMAPRSRCHGDPSLIHRAAHVLVFNRTGALLLQKRSDAKQIQPGRWDSSVGGHLEPGEGYRSAALREMQEELGISGIPLTYLFNAKIRNQIESENTATFLTVHDGPFEFCRREISEVRFWSPHEIESTLGSGEFTPNFEEEWPRYLEWCRRYLSPEKGVPGCASVMHFPPSLSR